MRIFCLLAAACILLYGCERVNDTDENKTYDKVWVPIYAIPNNLTDIGIRDKQPTENAGKIYVYNQYVLQNEQYKGFHVIDNTNPNDPQKIAFLKVPFSTEIAIKNNHLYTNNGYDLVVINISNIMQPIIVKRIANTFPLINQDHPPVSNTYFECVDKNKGVVVGWEQKANIKASCRR